MKIPNPEMWGMGLIKYSSLTEEAAFNIALSHPKYNFSRCTPGLIIGNLFALSEVCYG